MNEQMKKVTVKVALIALSAFSAFMMFPSAYKFAVSGYGMKESVVISGMTAFAGKINGAEIFDPMPWMGLCLILPIVAIVLMVIKKYNEDLTAKIVAGVSVANFLLWSIYILTIGGLEAVQEIKEYASDYKDLGIKVSVGPTFGFYLNLLVMALTIALAVFVILKKTSMETELMDFFKSLKNGGAVVQQHRCPACGAVTNADSKFCQNCGALVEAVKEEKAFVFCSGCGAKLPADSEFCGNCGEKVE